MRHSKDKLTVVIPVYNEEQHLVDTLVKQLEDKGFKYLIIDDGSTFPVEGKNVIRRPKNKGCGSAFKHGCRKAKTKYVGLIDADAQYNVMDLVDMWNSVDDEDLIIGRRVCHQGGFKRLWGRLLLKTCASLAAGKYLPDINSGVRIVKRNLMNSYASIICDEFSYSTSQTMAFVIDGCKVKWVDVDFYPREGTKSTVDEIRHGLVAMYHIIRIGFALRTRGLRKRLRDKKKSITRE